MASHSAVIFVTIGICLHVVSANLVISPSAYSGLAYAENIPCGLRGLGALGGINGLNRVNTASPILTGVNPAGIAGYGCIGGLGGLTSTNPVAVPSAYPSMVASYPALASAYPGYPSAAVPCPVHWSSPTSSYPTLRAVDNLIIQK